MKSQATTEQAIVQLRQLIDTVSNIVICCHKSPDGDAVGSTLAWSDYLTRQEGKHTTVVFPDAAPDFLQWMPGFSKVLRHDKKPEEVQQAFQEADLICCLDFNTSSRTDRLQPLLDASKAPKLLIDHHLQPDIDTVLSFSQPEMSSTCELLFNIISLLGGYEGMSKDCAQCLYCGMMTDTGGFTYNSSRPEIFQIIAQLLEKGIDKDRIYKRVFHNLSLWSIRLRAYAIYRKLRLVNGLRAAYFTLNKEEMQRFHFVKGDAEGLVNEPLRIRGLRLSVYLREDTEQDQLIHVSLRSAHGFHCQEMASRFFNGGGHEDAAGGKLFCTMSEAEQIVMQAFLAYRDELKR